MSGPANGNGNGTGRLDSWKAIAAYLNRDERTVRRWEQENGLPVRRVPGRRGASVFAYTSEIDEWLKTTPAPKGHGETAPARAAHSSIWLMVASLVAAVVLGLAIWGTASRASPEALRLEPASNGVVAFDQRGVERWRYRFSTAHATVLADGDGPPLLLAGGSRPAAYVATSFRARNSDGVHESGTLVELSMSGRPVREFAFADTVTFGGVPYSAPWAISAFAIDDSRGQRRIAVAAHHHVWNASLVTILDDSWTRRGTFVHSGWIESVRWLSPDRLLVAGYSNAHEGGLVALLDPDALDGQAPEPKGSPHHCESCATAAPLKMVVMPRTELNRVTVSRFNRTVIQLTAAGILARPIEVPSAGQDAVDSLYEFTPTLDLVRAAMSERYWELHRVLEAQGQLQHARDTCPERNGPPVIKVWRPDSGWTSAPAVAR